MNQNIENMVRAELERMGVRADDEQQETQPQQDAVPRVSVEEALSAAIGGPVAGSVPGLNNDGALAKIIGANTLNGKKL